MAVKKQAGTGGRAARQVISQPEIPAVAPLGKPLGPAQCRAYMRRTLAREFQGIVNGFVEQAKSGSCQHVKLATEFLEPRKRASGVPSGRATIARWVEEVERGC